MLRPAPTIGGVDDAPFWDACRRGVLMIQRCPRSGRYIWPIAPVSPVDLTTPLEWTEVSGKGAVSHFAVYNRVYDPLFKNSLPYVTACIDLDEGVRMTGNVFSGSGELSAREVFGEQGPGNALVGRRVEVFFEDAGNSIAIPQWKLV